MCSNISWHLEDLQSLQGWHVHQQKAIQADFMQRLDAHLPLVGPLQQPFLPPSSPQTAPAAGFSPCNPVL